VTEKKIPPMEQGWLDALVRAELSRHDPAAALARMPEDIRAAGASSTDLAPAARLLVARSLRFRHLEVPAPDAVATFREEVRLHVGLLLDLAALREAPFETSRRRAELAAFLAAGLGEVAAALEVLPIVAIPASARDIELALVAAERELEARFLPPGDPVLGLPLHPGQLAIQRRRFARVAMGYYRGGRLEPEALARHAGYAEREAILLAEALAGLAAADARPGEREATVRGRQVMRLGLSRTGARAARAAVAAPRAAAEIAAYGPDGIRPFLVEQLLLAQLRTPVGPGGAAFIDAFISGAGLDDAARAAAAVEAAAQHGDLQVWFEAMDDGAIDWQALAGDVEAATDAVVERVTTAVTENLGAIVQEIRQTGELGQLLARAAAGGRLTKDEKAKVRLQLVDLAKAVPALAIFAAPGGMLLLPLLAKLLPFNLLPSAWDRVGDGKAGAAKALPPKPGTEPKKAS
jgi:hypothetical protein